MIFEAAEQGHSLSKAAYKKALPGLREDLLDLQQTLRQADFPVIVVFAGVDGAGKGEVVNLLNEWMDPRWLLTRAYTDPSDEEDERPEFWRYWCDLPPKGQIGLFLSSWYSRPLLNHVMNGAVDAEFDLQLQRIKAFEKMLVDDGALILKFWMHLGKKQQKKRFEKLESDKRTRWRVSKTDWKHWKKYDQFVSSAQHLINSTATPECGWQIVDGQDLRYSSIEVARTLDAALHTGLQRRKQRRSGRVAAITPLKKHVLVQLDMTQSLQKKVYNEKLEDLQSRLNKLQRKAHKKKLSTVLAFEGWDAAGKGGAIRRLTHAMDARDYQVIPIAAPTQEELAQHYLWRFWRYLPRGGRMTLFDRSWYGRVLVERIEGFASTAQWRRAYDEINAFEEEMTENGTILCKFWVHITADEQLRRFKEREKIAYKAWKLTDEDWRNRDRWPQYERAVHDMVQKTSTRTAPWTLVEGNNKRFARIKVLETVCDRLDAAL